MSTLVYLCSECDKEQFPLPKNEGHIPLGQMRIAWEDAQLSGMSKGERLVRAIFDPPQYDPAITVSIDGVDNINLVETDEIQAGEDGWIISYGLYTDYGRCTRCQRNALMAVRYGSVSFEWLQSPQTGVLP